MNSVREVHNIVKDVVVGNVSIHNYDDVSVIRIEAPHNVYYVVTIDDIKTQCKNGETPQTIADNIITGYIAHVVNIFFKK